MPETASLSIRVSQEGVDQTAAALGRLTQSGAGAEQSFGNLALKIAGFSSVANIAVDVGRRIVSGLVDMGKESVVLAASFEKSRVTWGVLVGDMDKGSKVFDRLRDFANRTPLSFEGVNQAATTLKGFGVATDDLVGVMGKLGDVAMGDNNKLQSLALVYGQVMAQGKAKTQDLYQFINAGVPIFQLLGESMGKSAGEIKGLAADGAITFDEINKAITKATDAGGQFYDMMDRTAETTAGRWSTAQDNFKAILANLGTTVLPLLNRELDAFNQKAEFSLSKSRAMGIISSGKGDTTGSLSWVEAELAKNRDTLASTRWDSMGADFSLSTLFSNPQYFGLYSMQSKAQDNIEKLEELKRKLEEIRDVTRQIDINKGLSLDSAIEEKLKALGLMKLPAALTPNQQTVADAEAALRDSFAKLGQENAWATSQGEAFDLVAERAKALDKIISDLISKGFTVDFSDPKNGIRRIRELANELGYKGGLSDEEARLFAYYNSDGFSKASAASTAGAKTSFSTYDYIAPKVADINQEAKALNETLNESRIAVDNLEKGLASIAASGIQETFVSIGEALAAGSSGSETFQESMASVIQSAASSTGQLMMTAGLELIVANVANPVGWALFIAGGGLSIIGGFMGYNSSTSNGTSTSNSGSNSDLLDYYLQAEAFNQESRYKSALTGYAKGGIPTLPGFHAYRNQIVDTPHFFGFASGGVFGEAGAEAAVPLVRTRSGNLGVETSGAASVTINIHNNVGANVTQQESTGADGLRVIDVYIEKKVQEMATKGKIPGVAASGRRVTT